MVGMIFGFLDDYPKETGSIIGYDGRLSSLQTFGHHSPNSLPHQKLGIQPVIYSAYPERSFSYPVPVFSPRERTLFPSWKKKCVCACVCLYISISHTWHHWIFLFSFFSIINVLWKRAASQIYKIWSSKLNMLKGMY